MVATVIPWINDAKLDSVQKATSDAGASNAGSVLLRLPLGATPSFRDRLKPYPNRITHVKNPSAN